MSPPKSTIRGVVCERGEQGAVRRHKKADRYALARQVALSMSLAQVEGKRPKVLALATACVRLCTPSLP